MFYPLKPPLATNMSLLYICRGSSCKLDMTCMCCHQDTGKQGKEVRTSIYPLTTLSLAPHMPLLYICLRISCQLDMPCMCCQQDTGRQHSPLPYCRCTFCMMDNSCMCCQQDTC